MWKCTLPWHNSCSSPLSSGDCCSCNSVGHLVTSLSHVVTSGSPSLETTNASIPDSSAQGHTKRTVFETRDGETCEVGSRNMENKTAQNETADTERSAGTPLGRTALVCLCARRRFPVVLREMKGLPFDTYGPLAKHSLMRTTRVAQKEVESFLIANMLPAQKCSSCRNKRALI